MIDPLPWISGIVVASFTFLAVVAALRVPRSGPSGRWVAAAFGALALALLSGRLGSDFGLEVPAWAERLQLALVLAFPYLLLRFTASFRTVGRWIDVSASAAAAVVLGAAVAAPELVGADWFLAVVLVYWVLVSLVTVVRLWRAGKNQPTVARRRMRLMSVATGALAAAILLAVSQADDTTTAVSVQAVALASGMTFGLGFAPPRAVRLSWRRTEEQHLQQGTIAVLRAETVEDVAEALLPPTAAIVGAGGVALLDASGRAVAVHGAVPEAVASGIDTSSTHDEDGVRQVIHLDEGRGELVAWTSPYAPFFGRDEIELLHGMAAIAVLAFDRCKLIADERARQEALEEARHAADEARREAENASLAKSEFMSRMSHEFRTPLNAILGFGQVLETVELAEDDQQAVRQILKAGRHLLALIDDVLDLSRIEAGTLAISLEPVHAIELIEDTVSLVRPRADERSIRLSLDVHGCDVFVMTDRQRCRQVLLNLLSNAVKYNYDGGDVSVRCVRVSGESLRISVRDSGPGIDPARQAQLFEPFERLGAESSTVEGTGLGLALTRQLINQLGGRIGVDSALKQGSDFWIELPMTDTPADRADPVQRPIAPTATGERTLLLVEDNLANLRVVEAMLRDRPDITVVPAMQGRLAIELATQHLPDVIVLDLHLPDLPGRDVLARLKADRRTRDIPVVIASAEARPSHVRRLRELGAFEYITKPIDLRRFLETIDAAIGERDAARPHDERERDPDDEG